MLTILLIKEHGSGNSRPLLLCRHTIKNSLYLEVSFLIKLLCLKW